MAQAMGQGKGDHHPGNGKRHAPDQHARNDVMPRCDYKCDQGRKKACCPHGGTVAQGEMWQPVTARVQPRMA
ncbi:hypothetical protein JCM25156A_27310 [Komagataeibacter kakiaceti JCM 25156]